MIGVPAALALGGDEVHVWWIALDEIAAEALHALIPDEIARGSRFRQDVHRRRWLAARAALRHILAGYTGIAARDLVFQHARWGKPELQATREDRRGAIRSPGEGALRFNLAHAAERAVVAVARGREVGVDLERLDPALSVASLLAVICTAEEAACLAALPADRRVEPFLELWTVKEAYLKAIGTGFSREPRTLEIVAEDDGGIAVRDPATKNSAAAWHVRRLASEPGWLAALAVAGAEPAITDLRWPPFARHGTPGADGNWTAVTS